MPKIWTEQGQVKETPNRNNFDLSRQNHLTFKPGALIPIMCDPVVPGDSFEVNVAFGLKFMPLVFPIQSRMRAHVYLFGVRNKNSWEYWENFAQQLEEHVHPYIEQPSDYFKTGSLSDYLNVPTTQTGFTTCAVRVVTPPLDLNNPVQFRRGTVNNHDASLVDVSVGRSTGEYDSTDGSITNDSSASSSTHQSLPFIRLTPSAGSYQWNELVGFGPYVENSTSQMVFFPHKIEVPLSDNLSDIAFYGSYLNLLFDANNPPILALWINQPGQDFSSEGTLNIGPGQSDFFCGISSISPLDGESYAFELNSTDKTAFIAKVNSCLSQGYDCYFSLILPDSLLYSSYQSFISVSTKDGNFFVRFYNVFQYVGNAATVNDRGLKPFGSECVDSQRIRLNALPYRAYEACYNAFFRNTQNQPFYIDGVEQFNRYNTTVADGADTTPYHIFFRNWEMDFLTSALQSPQQGVAPLVGLTDTGTITISDQNGITTGTYEVDQDGTIGQVVITSPNASVEHGRIAMSLASAGFTINDFRGTNALTRWLEMNLRRGYKYMDFITGHFGQSPHYDSLDMPEFIGGFSQDVQVNMISSTADTTGSGGLALGEYAGQANCFGSSRHSMTHYCDDFGHILGIICVVPTPAYTQLLPKDFLRSQPLDYPYPEFSHLGLQPITYREVCPNQSYSEWLATSGNSGNNQDTFGYQRPNYDLVGHVDEVHGQFRSTLKNFLVNRIFHERPQLGDEFLKINPVEVNDIFTVSDPNEDTIIGQVVLDVKAKRPFPRVVVPNLGK